MKKEDVLKLCEKVSRELEEDLVSKNEEIKKGGDDKKLKSLKSVVCGIKKNYDLCSLLIKLISGEEVGDNDVKLIERLRYNKKVELKEVSKEEVIKDNLIDRVIIKKVDGANKYFIEC